MLRCGAKLSACINKIQAFLCDSACFRYVGGYSANYLSFIYHPNTIAVIFENTMMYWFVFSHDYIHNSWRIISIVQHPTYDSTKKAGAILLQVRAFHCTYSWCCLPTKLEPHHLPFSLKWRKSQLICCLLSLIWYFVWIRFSSYISRLYFVLVANSCHLHFKIFLAQIQTCERSHPDNRMIFTNAFTTT